MKRVWEKIVEGILTCSGFVTSITILLIVVFLFAEALGLFNKKVIEEGYVLAVNKANPVQELSAAQIKDVFDEEITNWKELGGPDAEVKVFRLEDITSYFSEEELGAEYEKAPRCIGEIVAGNPGIIAFVPSKFIEKDFPGHLLKDESISFDEVFAGKELKVHSFARIIGTKEGLDETSLFILEAAAYTHDIGIRPAEEKYGRCDGKLQEQEGPIVAQRMLSDVGIENYLIDRICYLIGHHHTYDNIEGLDYQILVEADFLVNLYEDDVNRHGIEQAYQQIFRTQTGKEIFNQMYTDER